jgi:hypothetical protein
LKDKLGYKPRGIFRLQVIDKNKNIIEDYIDKNLIVTGARNVVVLLLGGGSDSLTKIAMGIGTAEPVESDTGLTAPVGGLVYATITSTTYPTSSSIMFSWSLDYADGNGVDITEYGLFTTGDVLFSRKIRTVVPKTDTIALEGMWTLEY